MLVSSEPWSNNRTRRPCCPQQDPVRAKPARGQHRGHAYTSVPAVPRIQGGACTYSMIIGINVSIPKSQMHHTRISNEHTHTHTHTHTQFGNPLFGELILYIFWPLELMVPYPMCRPVWWSLGQALRLLSMRTRCSQAWPCRAYRGSR